jgi:nucleotide-binding universal stress UspA family protein
VSDRTVVVGVDLGEPSLAVAHWVASHLERPERVVLTHVVSVPSPPKFLRAFYPPSDQFVEDARIGAEARMRDLAATLDGASIRTEVRIGRPEQELAAAVSASGARLLVVGPHAQRPGLARLLGGTAERIARHASSSLLLARGLPAGAPATVLLALDDSGLADAMLAWGTWCARRFGARLVVLHVVPVGLAMTVVPGASATELERARQKLMARAQEWLPGRLSAAGLDSASTEVAFGDPGLEILSAVQRFGAGLLIIGRHGSGSSGGPFLGSVTEFLLRNGSAPVLVVADGPPD